MTLDGVAGRRSNERRRTHIVAFCVSAALHGAVLAVLWWAPARKVPVPVVPVVPPIEIEYLALVEPSASLSPAPAAPSSPASITRPRRRMQSPTTPSHPPTQPPIAVVDEPQPLVPASPADEPAAPTFRDWQRRHRAAFAAVGRAFAEGGPSAGRAEGADLLSKAGHARCEPSPDRRFSVLYLLFDSSGSMSDVRRAQALSCAHTYAKVAIEQGSAVVVANFARDTRVTGPTCSMLDVEVALRATGDGTATILPTAQLGPLFDADPSAVSELVIVSDGLFEVDGRAGAWYRYFLEVNPENRARMYAVRAPGQGDALTHLRAAGVDVTLDEHLGGSAL